MSITHVDSQSISQYLNIPYSDPKRWVTVYPIYLNKRVTIDAGRRVPLDCGVDYPTLTDIIDAINSTIQLQCIVEQKKHYSRNPYDNVGRVKIQLRNDDGTPIQSFIHNKSQLLRALCSTINDNPSRKSRVAADELAEKKFNEKYISSATITHNNGKSGKKVQKSKKK